MNFEQNGTVVATKKNVITHILQSLYNVISTLAKDDDCPFGPGSCPVHLDNVVDVFYHDVIDIRSCQRECNQIGECHFWTMFNVTDEPTDHKKCFLFKTCDHLDPCDECISGK